jgi:hypothetical protein
MQIENDGRNDFDFLVGNWIMRHRRLHVTTVRCEFKRMEYLLGGRYHWNVGCPDGWQIQGRNWRVLFTGGFRGQTHFLSLHLVKGHRELCSVGTGIFGGWGENLGNQLGEYVRANLRSRTCNQKMTGETILIS